MNYFPILQGNDGVKLRGLAGGAAANADGFQSSSLPQSLKKLGEIVNGDLCHRCGSCVGICPAIVLDSDSEGYPAVKNLAACTDCNLCVQVCPGVEFPFRDATLKMFGSEPDPEDIYGQIISGYLAFASDASIRQRGTSGGFITSLLISLLEAGEIDGAVVIQTDPNAPYKGIPKLARTKEELILAKKSKYAIVPTNRAFADVLATDGRYAFVGLPCQLHGLMKAAALDSRFQERIVLKIGLICHAAMEHEPLRMAFDRLGDRQEVTRFFIRQGKHPGIPHVMYKDGTARPVLFPDKGPGAYQPTAIEIMNILFRLYTPKRCMTCFDAMGQFADLAVGDPWMPKPADDVDFYKGYSYVVTRTSQGENLFHAAARHGGVNFMPLDDHQTRSCNVPMATEKRYRAFRSIRKRSGAGLPVPDYGFEIPRGSLRHRIRAELNAATHALCFTDRFRRQVLAFTLSNAGYALLWLNSRRRRFRVWRNDRWARRERTKKSLL